MTKRCPIHECEITKAEPCPECRRSQCPHGVRVEICALCPDPHMAEVDKLTRQINELQQTCKQMKAVMETPRIEDTEAIAALTIDRDYWKEIALRYNRDLKP